MNYSSALSKIEYSPDLPESINRCIPKLFGVDSLKCLSREALECIRKKQLALFSEATAAEYRNSSREYALYYLPVNFYKIWRPLLDLAVRDGLKSNCDILELGPGPGSATFGLIEFYRYLAIDSPSKEFKLRITAVERVKEFVEVFNTLLSEYQNNLPDNLMVDIISISDGAFNYLSSNPDCRFDIIVESNMLNPNEPLKDNHISKLAELLKRALKRHGTIIMIEPAALNLSSHLKNIRSHLINFGLNVYSPCCCSNIECSHFTSAQLDISGIRILSQQYELGIVSKLQKYHSFEYAVFRNDGLTKYDYTGTSSKLNDISLRLGEVINFKAFISAVSIRTDIFCLKLCDGSIGAAGDVWMNIPRSKLIESDINSLTIGRGGLIDVKGAVIVDGRNIGLTDLTRFKLYL